MTKRLFLALEIPELQREVIASSRREVERRLPRARWVPARNQHLTVKFLGATVSSAEMALLEELEGLEAPPVPVELGGGGFFPPRGQARVAWLGGTAPGAAELAEQVERAATRAGFEAAARGWALHLTQARLKFRWTAEDRNRFLAWADALETPGFVCRELVLMASDLRPSGAVYTPVHRWMLR